MAYVHGAIADLAVRSIQIMSAGEPADFEELVHPEAFNREGVQEPPASRGTGPAAFYATALWLRQAFADLHWQVHTVVTEGDVVAVHVTMAGRQVGPFVAYDAKGDVAQAFPATGKSFAITQTHWIRVLDGKVVEHWANRDDLGMSMQLGWNPPTPRYLLRMRRATKQARRDAVAR
ncbi:ester cyclase [Nocardia sp. XZ_19_231]|uniref:ester cyclase n=1 Tax=Nocardia sp. XZ_19_231 TaxID=2769252 RepID=UPI00188F9326|nr:ester cyclase [Nocardia sp. XZ_19_231]